STLISDLRWTHIIENRQNTMSWYLNATSYVSEFLQTPCGGSIVDREDHNQNL
ncbi:hypothetical protein HN51_008369, partial [Arachis hypogaea]